MSDRPPKAAGAWRGNPDANEHPKSTPNPTPMLVDASTAAVILGISARTLWSLTNRRAVPHRRIGRAVRYAPSELAAWIDAGCPIAPNAADRIGGAA